MSEFKTIAIRQIHVGKRLRQVNDAKAQSVAASIKRVGLRQPISVRFSPNLGKGKTPYLLIDGMHRLVAADLHLGWRKIPAMVERDDDSLDLEAEIHTNLIRNDLSLLERSDAVLALRRKYEEKHGPINSAGGRPKNKEIISTYLGVIKEIADEIGVSDRSIRNWETLKAIVPELRAQLYGTPAANQWGTLHALAKLDAGKQASIAEQLVEGKNLDWLIGIATEKPAQATAYSSFINSWGRIATAQKWQALDHIGVTDLLTDDQQAVLAERFGGARPIGDDDV